MSLNNRNCLKSEAKMFKKIVQNAAQQEPLNLVNKMADNDIDVISVNIDLRKKNYQFLLNHE